MEELEFGDYSQESEAVAVSSDEEDGPSGQELALATARFIIHAHSLGIVVKKSDVVKHCLKGRRTFWDPCKQRAKQLIQRTFGYSVQFVQVEKDEFVFLVEESTANRVPAEFLDDDQKLQKIFLFVVLGFLTLKGPPVTDFLLAEFLKKLHIEGETAVFGDSAELLNQLTNQQYLKRIKDDKVKPGEIL